MKGGQERSGTLRVGSGNTSKTKGGSEITVLSSRNREQTTTHYPHTISSGDRDKGGSPIEGQKLRGYVRNQPDFGGGNVKDATVGPDGTVRVRKL